jgi:SAM-dependent methyltransferase
MIAKAQRRAFLAQNPFPNPLTTGFFYREKMRAIHRIAPDRPVTDILEVGGGQSGLSSLLYPNARVVNIDIDDSYAEAAPNQRPNVEFVVGDATDLPFAESSFDAVTMFDLIEHVQDDRMAIDEAKRVLRPGGVLMISTPHTRWRYPHYAMMKALGPREEELFEEWGHVRRGYTLEDLNRLVGAPPIKWATFINAVTVIGHDIAFSHIPHRRKIVAALSPITWLGYLLHHPHLPGTETAAAWEIPVSP